MTTGDLNGRRILVVEDAPLIAAAVDDMLTAMGCSVVGPTGSMAVALELATGEALDAAVIDLNIRGGKVYPVAEALAARNVPFLLASGYADWTMPEPWRGRPRLIKPYNSDSLKQELLKILE